MGGGRAVASGGGLGMRRWGSDRRGRVGSRPGRRLLRRHAHIPALMVAIGHEAERQARQVDDRGGWQHPPRIGETPAQRTAPPRPKPAAQPPPPPPWPPPPPEHPR